MADFIGESPVSCRLIDTDRYGRVVANCHVWGRVIEEWLVSEGWAMAYTRATPSLLRAKSGKPASRGGPFSAPIRGPSSMPIDNQWFTKPVTKFRLRAIKTEK